MKSLILYGSNLKLSNGHKLVTGWRNQPDYYVRAETFNGDYPEALEKANPMPGELVLNSVPLPEPKTT